MISREIHKKLKMIGKAETLKQITNEKLIWVEMEINQTCRWNVWCNELLVIWFPNVGESSLMKV